MTTRDDIQHHFAEIDLSPVLQTYGKNSVWVYHGTSAGWGFFICGGGGYGPVGCDSSQDVRNTYLVMRFNEGGTLSRYDVATVHWGCANGGICRDSDGAIMVFADPEGARWLETPQPPKIGCDLYVYISIGWPAVELPLLVQVDGELIGGLTHKHGFFIHNVDIGRHKLHTTFGVDQRLYPFEPDEIEFECREASVIYAHAVTSKTFWTGKKSIEIVLENEDDGRRNIEKRSLALPVDGVAE